MPCDLTQSNNPTSCVTNSNWISGTTSSSYIAGTDIATSSVNLSNITITNGTNYISTSQPLYNPITSYSFAKDGEIKIDPDTGECLMFILDKFKWIECEIIETKKTTDELGNKQNVIHISFKISVSEIKKNKNQRTVLIEKIIKPKIETSIYSYDNLNTVYTIPTIDTNSIIRYINPTTTNLNYVTPTITTGTQNIICGGASSIGDIFYDTSTNNLKITTK